MEKVLLINLPSEGQCADFYTPKYAIESFSVYPPLGLLYVSTAIKYNYNVEIMDVIALRYSIRQIVDEIVKKSPSVLGISCQTFRLYPMVKIIQGVKAKLPQCLVVVGGPHTSMYPVETLNLQGVDYVIMGDGEQSFKQLLDALSDGNIEKFKDISGLVYLDGENIMQNPVKLNFDIDSMGIPDRSLLNYEYYYTAADETQQVVTMISSRGCPSQCIFCDVQEKRYRARSAKNVVDEMEYIVANFKNPIIHVFDDTFNINRTRVLEICDEIRARNLRVSWTTRARVHPFDEEMVVALKKAGLKRVHFGVESGSEKTLKNIKKGVKRHQIINAFALCQKYKIDTIAYFMIGFPWETKKDINETIKFAQEIHPTFIMANTLYPAAKTVIYHDLLKNGTLKYDFWQDFATHPVKNFSLPKWQNKATRQYLKRKLDATYLTFYLSPKFVIKNLRSKTNQEPSSSQFFFKIKLAFLIIRSYLKNLFIEKMNFSGIKNEIKKG